MNLTTRKAILINGMTKAAGHTITNQVGLNVAALTTATNNTEILLGTGTPVAGNWGIYQAGGAANQLSGNLTLSNAAAAINASTGGLTVGAAGALSLSGNGGNTTIYSSTSIVLRKAGNTGSTAISIGTNATYIMQSGSSSAPAISVASDATRLYRGGSNSTNQFLSSTNSTLQLYYPNAANSSLMQCGSDYMQVYDNTGAIKFGVKANQRFFFNNLPTSSSGLVQGEIYRSGTQLMIV